MNTAPSYLSTIETWESLSSVLYREGIDAEEMNVVERRDALEMWLGDRDRFEVRDTAEPVDDSEALRRLVSHFSKIHSRDVPVFCPWCGSKDLVEVCSATTYHTLRGVRLGYRGGRTIADRAQCDNPSIGEAEVWRCQECDFETESDEELLTAALIGGEIQGKVTIDRGVRVERLAWCSDSDGDFCLARVDLYWPESPAGWLRVVGYESDCLRLRLRESDGDIYKEAVMRRSAAEVKDVVEAIEQERLSPETHTNEWTLDVLDRMSAIEDRVACYEHLLDDQRSR